MSGCFRRASRRDSSGREQSRSEQSRSEPYRSDPYRLEPYRSDPYRSEPYRSDPYRSDSFRCPLLTRGRTRPETSRRKPLKVRRAESVTTYGVAASNLTDLITNACRLLQMDPLNVQCCLYEDGTIVTEDYFLHLPDDTLLVLLLPGHTWNRLEYELNQFIGLDRPSEQLITAAQQLLTDELSDKKKKILSDFLCNLNDNAKLENREEDPNWFEGLNKKIKTKSQYMKDRCKGRMQTYMTEVVNYATTIKKGMQRNEYLSVAELLKEKLKEHHCSYFVKTHSDRLCTPEGWFTCQGAFDQPSCKSHRINPYTNKENRILFSTWNLDHRIEQRTIKDTLFEALNGRNSKDINDKYFSDLLFSTYNIKLVAPGCHRKEAHNLQCDKDLIYKPNLKKSIFNKLCLQ